MLLLKIINKAIAEIRNFLVFLKRKMINSNSEIPSGEKIVGSNLVSKYVIS
tara:strand:+ start:1853 stop:2005 length:153 start_codon:yes stop_codon:yes gene_type:complete